LREAAQREEIWRLDPVRFELFKRLGYFVTESSEHNAEYNPYFIRRDRPDLVERFQVPIDEYLRRSQAQNLWWEQMRQQLLDGTADFTPERSNEYAALIIHSMETNTPRVIYGNVLNRDLITNLPQGCCVEVPCLVDRNGLQPTVIGEMPPQLAALQSTNINVQGLVVEAALTGKKEHVYHAAMFDPHTSAELTLDEIHALVDDLFQAHGEMIPPLFAQALHQGGNTHYTFRFFPGASHDIHQSPDGGVTSLPELAPGYAELVGAFVQAVTSGRLPQADAPVPPQQDWLSVPVPPLSWWESAWVQLAAFLLLLAAFAGYPLVALLRQLRGRSLRAAVGTPARLLSGTGVTVVLCFFVYMLSLLIGVGMGGREVVPDPVLAGRPLLWLLLQMLALVTVGAEIATAVAWRRAGNAVSLGERRRLGLLLAGGALFILWALYWGLLLP
jgi:hypothetical protein